MAIILSRIKLKETVKKYWIDEDTNLFNNYFDAILGFFGLAILPGASLISVFCITETNWSNYTFPLLSVCFSGLYDTYGRYIPQQAKNIKLGLRAVIDVIAFVLGCIFTGSRCFILTAIPGILLTVCGIGIIRESFSRVKTAIEVSKWAAREEDDNVVRS